MSKKIINSLFLTLFLGLLCVSQQLPAASSTKNLGKVFDSVADPGNGLEPNPEIKGDTSNAYYFDGGIKGKNVTPPPPFSFYSPDGIYWVVFFQDPALMAGYLEHPVNSTKHTIIKSRDPLRYYEFYTSSLLRLRWPPSIVAENAAKFPMRASGPLYINGGDGSRPAWRLALKDEFNIDLDVDSNNDGNIEVDNAEEDDIENESTVTETVDGVEQEVFNPGKLVTVNDFDFDNDSIPAYLDGLNLIKNDEDSGEDTVEITQDDKVSDNGGFIANFTSVNFRVKDPTDNKDIANLYYKFDYDASDPEKATLKLDEPNSTKEYPLFKYSAPPGYRLWVQKSTSRSSESVIDDGFFVPPDIQIPANKVHMDKGSNLFFLEALPGSYNVSTITVTAYLPDALDQLPLGSDTVRVSPVGVDLDIDSDNNDSFAEDDVEDPIESTPDEVIKCVKLQTSFNRLGKIVCINNVDNDNDGIPDFADGMNLNEDTADDDSIDNVDDNFFVPLKLKTPDNNFPNNMSLYYQFEYSVSNPKDVEIEKGSTDGTVTYSVPESGFRLWKLKSGSDRKTRNPESILDDEGGEFIPPAAAGQYISYEQLDLKNSKEFFIEAVQGKNDFTEFTLTVKQFLKKSDNEYVQVGSDTITLNPFNTVYEAATGVSPVLSENIPARGMNVNADVLLYNRQLVLTHNLFSLEGLIPLALTQTYRSYAPITLLTRNHLPNLPLGPGWTLNCNEFFYKAGNKLIYHSPDGREDIFPKSGFSIKCPEGYSWKVEENDIDEDDENEIVVTHTDGSLSIYKFIKKDGVDYSDYSDSELKIFRLVAFKDRFENEITYNYNSETAQLTDIIDTLGRNTHLDYDDKGRIKQIIDPNSRIFTYSYNKKGYLESVIYKDSKVTYQYKDNYLASVSLNDKKYMVFEGGKEINKLSFGNGPKLAYTFNTKPVLLSADDSKNPDRKKTFFCTTVTTPDKEVTQYYFDSYSQHPSLCTQKIVSPDKFKYKTSYSYTDDSRTAKIINPMGDIVKYQYLSTSETDRRGAHLVTDLS